MKEQKVYPLKIFVVVVLAEPTAPPLAVAATDLYDVIEQMGTHLHMDSLYEVEKLIAVYDVPQPTEGMEPTPMVRAVEMETP